MEEGRLPLPHGISHNGELWKVGDWVHIQNPNDVTKPVVAQIYRTWQDPEGQKWVNACWYYRPEQTVHQYEKHFYPNEVVKTGQYRDHQIDEITDRCFVMFTTRYSRGRPRGFPLDKEVYVCDSRYNEEKHKLNKIKTWASCLPDEVREKDYEMDLFDGLKRVKKVPSPILHLLQENTDDTEELPKPKWGIDNAPPVIGAVHKGPRDENVSRLFVYFSIRVNSLYSNRRHPNRLLRRLRRQRRQQSSKGQAFQIMKHPIIEDPATLKVRLVAPLTLPPSQLHLPPTAAYPSQSFNPPYNSPINILLPLHQFIRINTAHKYPQRTTKSITATLTPQTTRPTTIITLHLKTDTITRNHPTDPALFRAQALIRPVR